MFVLFVPIEIKPSFLVVSCQTKNAYAKRLIFAAHNSLNGELITILN